MKNELIDALELQVACYRRLAKLAELQHDHVQHNQTESLLEVLKSRQSVLDEITQLERVIAPAKRNWGATQTRIGKDLSTQAESLLTEARSLLEQITLSDRNDSMVLQQRKLNLGREINRTASAGRVNRTYAAAAYGTPQSRMNVQR